MASEYYRKGPERARRVNDLFAAIASKYDLINDLQSLGLHRLWKRRTLQQAAPQPGEWALDLCCGTGDFALRLAKQGIKVIALDFTRPMLEHARRRWDPRSSPGPIHFCLGDALALPIASERIDLVTVGYGLRNLAHLTGGLSEIHRVLKPEGRLVILDFSHPPNRLWRTLYLAYLQTAVPLLGRWLCGNRDAYAYILESLKHYPGPDAIGSLLTNVGFHQIRWVPWAGRTMVCHYAKKSPGPPPRP